MKIKHQYDSLDTSKLPKEVLFEVNEIKEDTENFSNIPDFIKEDWKILWNDIILKKYKSAIKVDKLVKPSKADIAKKKAIEKFLRTLDKEVFANDYAYVFSQDLDRVTARILDSDTAYEKHLEKMIKRLFRFSSTFKKLYEENETYATYFKPKSTKKTPKLGVKKTSAEKLKTVVSKEQVAHFSEEYKLIRRFWNTIHKEITFRKAQLLYWAFEKAIVSRKVRKTSDKADLFNKVNEKVVALFKLMEGNEVKVIKKLEIKDEKLYKEIESFVKGQKVDTAVRLLNRFIGLQGKDITKIQATRLLNAIEKASIEKSNRLYDELQKAKKELKTFLDTGKEPIEPSSQTLSGIEKPSLRVKKKIIVESSEPVPVPIVDNGLFVQATQRKIQKAPNTFRLKGEIGKFMQDLQRYRLTITITGDPHAGKSEFVKALVNAFLNEGLTCGFFDLEQGGIVSKDTAQSIDRNITKENQKRLFVSGEAPNGIDTIKQFANQFDIVVIDSWQKLNIPNTRFDELRQEFPDTIIIIIFQQNGTGGTRGGVTVDYDTPIAIKVHKVDATFKNNYAELIKNRGNAIGLKYYLHSRSCIDS